MNQKFNPSDFEDKWREYWEQKKIYKFEDNSQKEKYYVLDMYPYPSGSGLHVGHPRGYLGTDVVSRFNRMQGKNVLYPMGFDSFGLPAENYAIKTGVHPEISTNNAIEMFKEQISRLGLSYDWDMELMSHDPEYMRWTQWLFLQFYKAGLAYRKSSKVNWCPSCQTVLANEQVEDGNCERCDSEVIQKEMMQWFLKITDYADELIEGLQDIDWPNSTKLGQVNWIGRSDGAKIRFELRAGSKELEKAELEVFTTRPDTIFGATFMVVAPEHPFIKNFKEQIRNYSEIEEYIAKADSKTELERQQQKEKTGIEIEGARAVNPLTNEEIPVYVADYVLMGYGTGAIMAVPAHDERDFEFATKYGITVKDVVAPEFGTYKKHDRFAQGVTLVVFDIETHKFCLLKWKQGWRGLVAGNTEGEENFEETAKRELQEETGLVSVEKIEMLGSPVYGNYYHNIKKQQVHGVTQGVLIYLENTKISKTSKESHEDFELEWVDASDMYKYIEILGESDHWLEIVKRSLRRLKAEQKINIPDGLNIQTELLTTDGRAVNSEFLNGLTTKDAKEKILEYIEEKGIGERVTNYRLRDWLISRQRYWGCPIPIVYDSEGNPHIIEDKDLPLLLPKDVDYKPKGTSPLGSSESYKKQAEEKYGEGWRYEVDTFDTFIDSSWYFFRFADRFNQNEFASKEVLNKVMPVDLYVGGAEHTVLHLMYARFFTKFLRDQKYLDFDEPFQKLRHQGTVLAEDGRKMSKRWGNTINPNDEIDQYGADTMRVYEMFMGPFDATMPWNTKTEVGVYRFLNKVWDLQFKVETGVKPAISKQEIMINITIKKVTEDIHSMSFNTAVAKMMELTNFLQKEESISKSVFERFMQILSPFAPFITEEIWQTTLGHDGTIHLSNWPSYDEALTIADQVTIGVQVNGKMRGSITISPDAPQDDAMSNAMEVENIKRHLISDPKKVIYVPGKILNIIV